MKVKELIKTLELYDPELEVTMTVKNIRFLKVTGVDALFSEDNSKIESINLMLK